MKQRKQRTKQQSKVKSYVVIAYLVFWAMVLFICGGASMLFHASPLVMRILSNICAWSPTMVVLLMWKKLRPEQSRKEFIKEAFCGKLKIAGLLVPPMLIMGGVLITVWILSFLEKNSFTSYFTLGGYSLWTSVFLSLLSGPTGEELGWRGYLRVELNRKYPFLRASIYQGLIWTFWHTVLWFVDSDYTGLTMIPYMLSNVIVITCITIVMNVVLEKHNNLVYAVSIHFAFNIMYCFLQIPIWFYVILCVVFVFIASGFLLYRQMDNGREKTYELCR
ncbi:MAG: type II CAAX endopeptidase family protein [Lachnospiraceae bacterium]|nr:type II CAAX endopeptidase family protein [Lachnospiraceae bacterium]